MIIATALAQDWYLAHRDKNIKNYSLKHLYRGAYHEGAVK
jgi:PIN domain nuclease of toxin-antitoxin system